MNRKIAILFEQSIISGSNFIFTVLAARLLSIEDFGIFVFFLALVLFISSLHQALIVQPMMSLPSLVNKNKTYRVQLQNNQLTFVFLSTIVFGFTYLIVSIFVELPKGMLVPILFVVVFNHMQDYFRRLHFLDGEEYTALLSSAVAYSMRFIILLFMYFGLTIELGVNDFFWALSIAFGLSLFVSLSKLKQFKLSYNFIPFRLRTHNKTASWLMPSAILQWTSLNIFFIVAMFVLSPVAIAVIRIGQNLTQIVSILLSAGENYFPIKAANIYKQKGTKTLVSYLSKVLVALIFSLFILSLFIYYFKEDLIEFLYGIKYVEFSYIVTYFLIFSFQMIILSIISIFFRVIRKTQPWFIGYISSSAISLVVVYPLELYYGLDGAVFGMLLAQFVLMISSIIFYLSSIDRSKVHQ